MKTYQISIATRGAAGSGVKRSRHTRMKAGSPRTAINKCLKSNFTQPDRSNYGYPIDRQLEGGASLEIIISRVMPIASKNKGG